VPEAPGCATEAALRCCQLFSPAKALLIAIARRYIEGCRFQIECWLLPPPLLLPARYIAVPWSRLKRGWPAPLLLLLPGCHVYVFGGRRCWRRALLLPVIAAAGDCDGAASPVYAVRLVGVIRLPPEPLAFTPVCHYSGQPGTLIGAAIKPLSFITTITLLL